MKTKQIAYLISFLLSVICHQFAFAQIPAGNKNLAKKIVGTWVLTDMDFAVDSLSEDGDGKQEFEQLKAEMEASKANIIGKVSFIFLKDGVYMNQDNTEGNNVTKKGTWELKNNTLTLKSKSNTESEEFNVYIQNDILHLKIAQDGIIMLLKLKK